MALIPHFFFGTGLKQNIMVKKQPPLDKLGITHDLKACSTPHQSTHISARNMPVATPSTHRARDKEKPRSFAPFSMNESLPIPQSYAPFKRTNLVINCA
jgi:hypothetical protein